MTDNSLKALLYVKQQNELHNDITYVDVAEAIGMGNRGALCVLNNLKSCHLIEYKTVPFEIQSEDKDGNKVTRVKTLNYVYVTEEGKKYS